MIRGVDLSAFQARLTPAVWQALAAEQVRFAFVRCQVGLASSRDGLFVEDVAGAREAAVRVGPYLFFDPTLDPIAQAEAFVRSATISPNEDPVGSRVGDLPPAVDVESPPPDVWTARGLSKSFLLDRAFLCLERVELLFGCVPRFYSYPYWVNSIGGAVGASRLGHYPLWIAGGPKYINGDGVWPESFTPPKVAIWGADAQWWQFDGNGGHRLSNGVDVDCNLFNGDERDLARLCREEVTSPGVQAPDPATIAATEANVLVEDAIAEYRRTRDQGEDA